MTPLRAADEKFKELFDMEVQNRAFALKSSRLMASQSTSENDKHFYGSWAAFEQRLKEIYAPYAKKYGLSQEARGLANLQVGIGRLAVGVLPESVVFESLLDQTSKYLEKLKELDRMAPEEDAKFFAFVVEQEKLQVDALKLCVEGEFSKAAGLLTTFTQQHSI